jgi:hypothetical protein
MKISQEYNLVISYFTMGIKLALIYMSANHNDVETMQNDAMDMLSNGENDEQTQLQIARATRTNGETMEK